MAKKPAPKKAASAAKDTASTKPDREVIPLISDKDFRTMMRKLAAAEKEASECRGSIGGIISDAVEHKNAHKGALGIFRRVDKMSDKKRSELLYSLDHMRSMSNWDDQLDLFKAGAGEQPEEPASDREAFEEDRRSLRVVGDTQPV